MPLIIKTPYNPDAVAGLGAYPQALNVLDRKATAVQRQLRRGGLASYEPVTQAALLALMELAPPGAAFFDVGAHIGLYAALVETVFRRRGVTVVAFEPTPATAEISRRLRQRNGLSFELFEVALSAEPGTATMYVSDAGETSNSLDPAHRAHVGEFPVDVSTLDTFTARRGIDPAVLKIDVGTGESQVLAGAFDTIERSRPAIVCEIVDEVGAVALEPQMKRLTALGYVPYPLVDALPWPTWHPRDLGVLPADERSCNWLFLPAPAPAELTAGVGAWLTAVAACDEGTNRQVARGALGPDWNADYPPSSSWRGRWTRPRRT